MNTNYLKKGYTLFVIALLITTASVLVVSVNAQELPDEIITGPAPAGVTEDMRAPMDIGLMIRPNPIGLNQIFLANIWSVRAPGSQRAFLGYEITITKPSGQEYVFTMDSFVADGTAWFEWIADEVGDWTIQVVFPGNWFPAGFYVDGERVNASGTSGCWRSTCAPPSGRGPCRTRRRSARPNRCAARRRPSRRESARRECM